jgi:hypothetical protein
MNADLDEFGTQRVHDVVALRTAGLERLAVVELYDRLPRSASASRSSRSSLSVDEAAGEGFSVQLKASALRAISGISCWAMGRGAGQPLASAARGPAKRDTCVNDWRSARFRPRAVMPP